MILAFKTVCWTYSFREESNQETWLIKIWCVLKLSTTPNRAGLVTSTNAIFILLMDANQRVQQSLTTDMAIGSGRVVKQPLHTAFQGQWIHLARFQALPWALHIRNHFWLGYFLPVLQVGRQVLQVLQVTNASPYNLTCLEQMQHVNLASAFPTFSMFRLPFVHIFFDWVNLLHTANNQSEQPSQLMTASLASREVLLQS